MMIARFKDKRGRTEIVCWASLLFVGFLAGVASAVFLILMLERFIYGGFRYDGISLMPPSWFFAVGGVSIAAFPIIGAVAKRQLDAVETPTSTLLKAALLIWLLGICIAYRYAVRYGAL